MSFPYDAYGLDTNGNYKVLPSYQGESFALKPDGYSNTPYKFRYSCTSTVAELINKGKTAIFTDEAETHFTFGRLFEMV